MRVRFELRVIRIDERHAIASRVAQTHPTRNERRVHVHDGESLDDAVEIAPADEGQRETVARPGRQGQGGHPEDRAVGFDVSRYPRREAIYFMPPRTQAFGEPLDRFHDAVYDGTVNFGKKADAEGLHCVSLFASNPRGPGERSLLELCDFRHIPGSERMCYSARVR